MHTKPGLQRNPTAYSAIRGLVLSAALFTCIPVSQAQVIDNPVPPTTDNYSVLVPTITAGGDNTLNSINFSGGGFVLLLNDTLFITSGFVDTNVNATILQGTGAGLLSATAGGDLSFSGLSTLTVNADINSNDDLFVNGTLISNGQVSITDALLVNTAGSLAVNGILTADSLTMSGIALDITGTANITTNAIINAGTSTVSGLLNSATLFNLGGTLEISGTANATTGTALAGGATTVTATGTLNTGQLQVDSGTLDIDGIANVVGLTAINGGVSTVTGTLNSGSLTTNDGFLDIDGVANVAGPTAINGGVSTVNGTLNSGSLTTSGGFLDINGVANVAGPTAVNGGVSTVNGTLNSGSLTTNGGFLDVNGVANVGGSTAINGGISTVVGTLNSGSLITTGGLLDIDDTGSANIVGTAAINGGVTIVDGVLAAGSGLTVGQEGFLTGRGIVNANFINNGLVAPGRPGSVGTLTVNGDFTQNDSGVLAMDVNGNSASDLLVVSGNVSLDGTLIVNGGDGLEFGDRVNIIRASGGIDGNFDAIAMNMGTDYRGRFLIDGNEGILLIAPGSYTQMAQTQNQRNVAGALDSFISATSGDRETVSIALDSLRAEEYPGAFDAISPAIYQSLPQISLEQTNSRNQMLAQRTNAIRLGARGFTLTGMELSAIKNDRDGKSVMDAKSTKDVISTAPENNWAVWMQGNGIFARAQNISNVPNYRFDSGGFMGGLDYRWNKNFSTGLYAGYQGTSARYNNGSRTNINSTLFGTYATYDNGGFYVDAIVGGTYDAYNVRRSVQFGSVDRTAKSDPDGGQVTAFLGTGYDWEVGGFTFGPLVSAQYTYVGVSGATESGADSLDLKMDQQNVNSIRTNIGGHIAYTWNVSSGFKLIPEIRMTWQHEYLNGSENINTSLDGGAGPSFDYATSRTGQDSVFAGAGVTAQMGDRWTASAYWNVDFASQNYESQMVSASLNFKF